MILRIRATARTRCRPAGFSLIEMVVVMSMVAALAITMAAVLWGAIEVERADSAAYYRLGALARLADQFREDCNSAIESPDRVAEFESGAQCLILRAPDGPVTVYRWNEGEFTRCELEDGACRTTRLSLGSDFVSVRIDRSKRDAGLVSLWLIESRGAGSSRRDWSVELTAAIGANVQ